MTRTGYYERRDPARQPTGCPRLGAALRAARKARGLTQTELGERTGFSQARIAQWEKAHRRLSAAHLRELAWALNIDVEGVHQHARSAHHGGAWCAADLGGVLRITCRSTGNVIHDPAGERAA